MIQAEIENEVIKLWLEDDYVFGEYKANQNIDLEKALITVRDRLAICNGKNYPHIIFIDGIKSTSKEARDYFSKNDGIKHMSAMALITNSPVSRSIGNFFLFLTKPAVVTKIFTDVTEAKAWAKKEAALVE